MPPGSPTELAAHGVGESSRVAWQLPTWLETLVVTSALVQLRAVQVPLPYSYRTTRAAGRGRADRRRAADHSRTAGAVTTTQRPPPRSRPGARVEPGRRRPGPAGQPERARLVGSRVPGSGRSERSGLGERGEHGDGGTVAAGPALGLLHVGYLVRRRRGPGTPTARVTVAATTMADALALTSADRSAIAFPLGHIGGVAWLIAAGQTGCMPAAGRALRRRRNRCVRRPRGDPGRGEYRVPPRLPRPGPGRSGATVVPNVRGYPGGAATKPPTLHHELRTEIGGIGILSGYGLTECPMITMSGVTDADDKLSATEGRPGPG